MTQTRTRSVLLFSTFQSLIPAVALLIASTAGRASVVSWGDNTYHQTNPPTGLTGVRKLSAGYWHTLAIKPNKTIVAWGLNDYGQTNVPVVLNTNAVAVAAGRDHSLALTTFGTVVGWGINGSNNGGDPDYFGQAEPPPALNNVSAISAGGFHSAALENDGTVVCWGYNQYGQCNPPSDLTNATAISLGNAFSLALRSNGTVAAWGDDFYGQTDVPAGLTNVVAIAAGGFHAIALKGDGTVVAWGYDAYGQTDLPVGLTNVVSIAAGVYHNLALSADGSVAQWGDTALGQGAPPSSLSRVIALSAGFAHTAAAQDDSPLILIQPPDLMSKTGKAAVLTITATGAVPITNKWYKMIGTTNSLQGQTVVTTSTNNAVFTFQISVTNSSATSVNYYAVVTNAFGVVTSRIATVSFLVPPIITNQPIGGLANVGDTVLFSVGATGGAPLTYQWQLGGVNLGASSTSNVLELDNVTTNDAGSYRVIVSNPVGSVTSQVASVTIGGSPLFLAQPQNQSVILGSNATFSASADGTQPLLYQWFFNRTNLLIDATNNSYTANFAQSTDAGSYSLVVTNDFGSATSSLASLTILLPPSITVQPPDMQVKTGKVALLTMTATGSLPVTNKWWRIGPTNALAGTSGFASSTNLGSVTFQLSVSNSVTTNLSYFGIISNAFGTLTSRTATVSWVVPPVITNQPQSVAAQTGDTVLFTVGTFGGLPFTYQWRLAGVDYGPPSSTNVLELDNVSTNDAGDYRVVISNSVGSITSQVASLTVDGSPVILMQPTNQTVVQGGTANFMTIVGGTLPFTYQWWHYGTNAVPDGTNSLLTVSNAQPTDAGNYVVSVENDFGSVTSSVATLTVLLPPNIVTQPVDTLSKTGKTAILTLTANGTFPMANKWYKVSGVSNTLASTTTALAGTNGGSFTFSFSIANSVTNSFNYYGVVSNAWGLITSRVASVTFLLPPVITNQPQSLVVQPGDPASLSVGVFGAAPFTYQWQLSGTNVGAPTFTNVLDLAIASTNDAGDYQVIITNSVGSVTSQVATLVVARMALTPARIWLLTHSGAAGDGIFMALEAGKNYRLQGSSNLADWVVITNFLSSSELMSFTNSFATNADQMFYRIISP